MNLRIVVATTEFGQTFKPIVPWNTLHRTMGLVMSSQNHFAQILLMLCHLDTHMRANPGETVAHRSTKWIEAAQEN